MPPQNNTNATNKPANPPQNNTPKSNPNPGTSNQNPTSNQANNQNTNQGSPTPATKNNLPQQQTNTDPNANLTSKVHPEGFGTQWRRTKCMVCGYVHEGNQVLKNCPKCGNDDPDKLRETD
jgi:hypothetical protein